MTATVSEVVPSHPSAVDPVARGEDMADFSGVILQAWLDHANEKLLVRASARPAPLNVNRTMSLEAAKDTGHEDVSVLVLELTMGAKGADAAPPWRFSASMEKPRGFRHVVLMYQGAFVALAPIEDWKAHERGAMPEADAELPPPK